MSGAQITDLMSFHVDTYLLSCTTAQILNTGYGAEYNVTSLGLTGFIRFV